jgi:uncharacterized glyoxalase superfamily protein PhnB
VDFYRRAFGLELRFFDEALGFAELETGSSTLAIAAHSLGEMLMPDGYIRPVDGQPSGVEIAFLTRDVSASFAKAIAEGASPITAPRRMPWGLEVAYVRAYGHIELLESGRLLKLAVRAAPWVCLSTICDTKA